MNNETLQKFIEKCFTELRQEIIYDLNNMLSQLIEEITNHKEDTNKTERFINRLTSIIESQKEKYK